MELRFTIAFLLLSAIAQAQPVITAASQPVAGDVCAYRVSSDPFLLPIGPDQVWDLSWSNLIPDYTQTFVAAGSAPGASHFPTADLALTQDLEIYEFLDVSPSTVYSVGGYNSGTGGWSTTPDPGLRMIYPCTYGTQWADPYIWQDSTGSTVSDTTHGNAAAYGDLLLPSATVHNLLGLEWHGSTVFVAGPDTSVASWQGLLLLSPWSRCWVARLYRNEIHVNGSLDDIVYYAEVLSDDNIGMHALAMVGLELWPMPAHGSVNLRWPGVSGPVDVQLLDATGRVVHQQRTAPQDDGTMVISLRSLVPGSYVLRAVDGTGRTMARPIVVEP